MSAVAALLILLAGVSPAAAVPLHVPIDDTITVDRPVLVWFETSAWDAGAGQTPDNLDGTWSGPYTANLTWASATVSVSAADFTDVVDQSDASGSVLSGINMSSYAFQIDTVTGEILTGAFTGSALHNGAAVSWSGSVDASSSLGYDTNAMTAMAVDGTFGYWRSCAMGGMCSIVGGVTGTIDWTFTDAMGAMTVTVFNPFGNLVVGEVPEPSTALLLGLGLVGLGIAGRSRD